jgi:hypothetical protein
VRQFYALYRPSPAVSPPPARLMIPRRRRMPDQTYP